MHRCLAIPDVQRLICESIRDWLGPWVRGSSLLALALTCRAFTEPALDSLYYELRSLWPLIQCLPHDAWVITVPPKSRRWEKTISLRRALDSSDAATIQKYSKKVRIITINSDTNRVDDGVFRVLSFYFPGCLLPNLRWLRFLDSAQFPISQYIHLFIAPGLKSLRINLQALDTQTGSLINSLPSLISPSALRDLHLLFYFSKERPLARPHPSCLSSCIGTWHNLQVLRLTVADFDAILQASKLPKLHKLMVANFIDRERRIEPQLLEQIASPFPALQSMTTFVSLSQAQQLLPFFRGSKLERLYITKRSVTDNSALSGFMESVGKYCKPDLLKVLWIDVALTPAEGLRFSDIVKPLLRFSMLESFKITLNKIPALTTQETAMIKRSWPNLRTLHIASHHGLECDGTKLSALLPFASGLTKLRRLILDVNVRCPLDRASLFETYQRSGTFGPCNLSLKYLDVRSSTLSHKEFVATFLSEVFPNLSHIRSKNLGEEPEERTSHRRWQTVGQVLLPLLRMTKRNEQRRLSSGDDVAEGLKESGDKDGATRLVPFWCGGTTDDDEDTVSDGHRTDEDGSDVSTEEESDYGE